MYFIADNMNTKYFMFCLVNFMSFVNIHPFLSFRPATHSKKSWDSKAFTHFVMLPFLFTTLKRRLGTEDTKWWSVSGVILSHSSCKQVLRWATVRGLRCRILRFKCTVHSTVLTGICGCNYVLWYLTKVCQSSPEPMWWYHL